MSTFSIYPRYASESTLFIGAAFALLVMLVIAAVAGAPYAESVPASVLLVGA